MKYLVNVKLLLVLLALFIIDPTFSRAEETTAELNVNKYQVSFPVLGRAHRLHLNYSLAFSYLTNESDYVGLRYFNHKQPRYEEHKDIFYTGESFEVFYKNFHTTSFYTRFSYFYRYAEIKRDSDASYSYRDGGLGIAIGNQWQWSGKRFLGVDRRKQSSKLYFIDQFGLFGLFFLNFFGVEIFLRGLTLTINKYSSKMPAL